jgi:DNA-binding GntR family transcriptional regulator
MEGRGHGGDLAMLEMEERPATALTCAPRSTGSSSGGNIRWFGQCSLRAMQGSRNEGWRHARSLASLAKVFIATIWKKYTVFFLLGKRHSFNVMTSAHPKSSATTLAREGNLSDRIYAELRRRLQRTPLGPDERLFDLDVAATYGTSRMPARDALLRLVNEGYLVGTTRGFVAPTLGLDDVREIFEVRRMLEPHAIAGVAREIDAAAALELREAVQRARHAVVADDGEEMMQANMAFRHAWLGRVKNRRLAGTIARFVDHVQTVRLNTLSNAETRQVVMNGLERLYEALINRDEFEARERMTVFMADAEHAFFSIRKAELDDSPRAGRTERPAAQGRD